MEEKTTMRLRKLSLALGLAALAVAALGALPAFGSDHRDAPLAKDAAKSDLADLYVFPGEAAGSVVLVMTVNPFTTPADTSKLAFDPATNYEFKIDTNGDAVADTSYKFEFGGSAGVQDVTIRRADGPDAITNDRTGTVIGAGKTSAGAGVTTIAASGGLKAYAGPRDDPFFFDFAGFQAGLKFSGVDTFRSTNVTAIVLELASAPAGSFGAWAATSKADAFGAWNQIDRIGRPGINTIFIPTAKKDFYNSSTPDRDRAIFTGDVKATLDALKSPATDMLAALLLPDVLTCDLAKAAKYFNCRSLADDVMDISLQQYTGNPAAGDGVDRNENAFLARFPYLAAPNGSGAVAPLPPNTGSGAQSPSGGADPGWTLPAGLIAAAVLLTAAGLVNRRRGEARA